MKRAFMRWVGVSLLLLIPTSATGQTAAEIEAVFWRSVACGSGPEVELYLETYPSGAYVAEAWACLEEQLGLERANRILVQQGLAGGQGAGGEGVCDTGAGRHTDGVG